MKIFFKKHSIVTFLLVNFAWTWLFWFLAVPFREQRLLLTGMVMIGGYGPAIGALAVLALKDKTKTGFSIRRTGVFSFYFIISVWSVCIALPGWQYPRV